MANLPTYGLGRGIWCLSNKASITCRIGLYCKCRGPISGIQLSVFLYRLLVQFIWSHDYITLITKMCRINKSPGMPVVMLRHYIKCNVDWPVFSKVYWLASLNGRGASVPADIHGSSHKHLFLPRSPNPILCFSLPLPIPHIPPDPLLTNMGSPPVTRRAKFPTNQIKFRCSVCDKTYTKLEHLTVRWLQCALHHTTRLTKP